MHSTAPLIAPRPHLSPVCGSVVILVADGARPDTFEAAMNDGTLPALARLRAEGSFSTVTSVFPSVTGPAYTPFLTGRFPGPVGLPGLRWYDRMRTTSRYPHFSRSYVGAEMRHVDADLDPAAPTLFELAPSSLGALNMIGRGLRPRDRIARSMWFALRAGRTHFAGDVRGWLTIDRDVCATVSRRVREDHPAVVFAAFTGTDKASHAGGHDGPVVREALQIVDATAAGLRRDAEADGRWARMQIWVVSDHGHSPVSAHDDLAAAVRSHGHRTIAHPWVHQAPVSEVAVMVSGNAMAHVYLELQRRERPWWAELAPRWSALADALVAHPSVDLMILPLGPDRCEVRSATRGRALVVRSTTARAGSLGDRYGYRPLDGGDPLGLGATPISVGAREAHAISLDTDYPDSLVQIACLGGAPRAGEMILSAARGWDFREDYEPIPHVSSHGALHREHMLVPLLTSRPLRAPARRTTDVMPSALVALGLDVPAGLDGESFV